MYDALDDHGYDGTFIALISEAVADELDVFGGDIETLLMYYDEQETASSVFDMAAYLLGSGDGDVFATYILPSIMAGEEEF